jgi:vacuolar protein sorting-associated protein 45
MMDDVMMTLLYFFRPQDIIVFIVGGITFEEAFTVAELNKLNPNCRIMLGGTFIHNSTTFLNDLSNTMKKK